MDRESYEAGFRAAQAQSQQPQQEGGGFVDALGKTALGLGIAAGAFAGGRGLLQSRAKQAATPKQVSTKIQLPDGSERTVTATRANPVKPSASGKTYTRNAKRIQVDENNVRVAKEWSQPRQGSLTTGVNLPSASAITKTGDNFPIQKVNVVDLGTRGAKEAATSQISNLGVTPETPGQLPRGDNTFNRNASPGTVGVADMPTRQDQRLLPAAEPEYKAAGRIDPQEFVSSEVQQARREAGRQDLLANAQARSQTFQPEIPGVKGDLMSIRSKTGFDPAVTGELVAEAPSRPITSKPDQLKIDFAQGYLKDQGYVEGGTSVQAQQARRPAIVEQSVEAADTALDQEAMRISRTVQRDPGENLAAFDRVQDSLEQRGVNPVQAAEQAVEKIEGTPAFTQTDAPATFGPVTATEMKDLALAEMKSRRALVESAGLKPGTTRYERALAEPFRTSANVRPQGAGESMQKTTLPAGPLRQTVEGVSVSEYVPEKSVRNIGPEAELTQAASNTSIRGAGPVLNESFNQPRTRQTFGAADDLVKGAPDDLMPDKPGRPETRPKIFKRAEPGASSVVVEEVRDGGSAGIGVYGVEESYVPGAQSKTTGEYSAAAYRKPTEAAERTLDKVRNPYSQLSDDELGMISNVGSEAEAYNADKILNKRSSLDVSRAIQRLQKSGRPDAQDMVRSYLDDLRS